MKVWIDGRVVDASEARIPVTDHGFLYGDGVFEGLRVYARRVFRLARHLERLSASARTIGLELPGGAAAMERIVLETARAFGKDEAYVRLVVSRGEGPLGVDPTLCPTPRVVCLVDEVQLYSAEKLARGIDLATASVRRPAPDVIDPRVKSLNYLNSVLAKREAKLRGADEALILNAAGQIAEASVANVFAVKRGALLTPPPTDGALEGITRDTVLDLARGLGIPAAERTLGRVDLFGADEVFLSGTGARLVPVGSLDGTRLGGAIPGPVFHQLALAFGERVKVDGVPIDVS